MGKLRVYCSKTLNKLSIYPLGNTPSAPSVKKDLAEVKAYAEAMADSNHARDAYVDKEQVKFFRHVNRQQADIDTLKEQMEWSELRARALELENELLSACLDSMVDKLCFCTWAEVTSQVVSSDLSNG